MCQYNQEGVRYSSTQYLLFILFSLSRSIYHVYKESAIHGYKEKNSQINNLSLWWIYRLLFSSHWKQKKNQGYENSQSRIKGTTGKPTEVTNNTLEFPRWKMIEYQLFDFFAIDIFQSLPNILKPKGRFRELFLQIFPSLIEKRNLKKKWEHKNNNRIEIIQYDLVGKNDGNTKDN